jgi:hypothetical protein
MHAELTSIPNMLRLEITDSMIIQAAFNELAPELWTVITDDDHIDDFHDVTKALRRSLQDQLAAYKTDTMNGQPQNVDWYCRIKALEKRLNRLLQALRQKIKDRTRRHYDRLGRIRYKLLRRAIIEHQEATLADGETTEQDRLLWTALAETWAMGSDDPQPVGRGRLELHGTADLEADKPLLTG